MTVTAARSAPGRRIAPPAAGAAELTVNYLPVRFTGTTFNGGTFAYESADQLNSLRSDLIASHTVIRDADRIVCVPFVADAEPVGTATTFSTDEDLTLTVHLLRAALVRVLTGRWSYQLRRFAPPTFVSRRPGRDLLAKALHGSARGGGLHVFPQYTLDTRRSGPGGHPGILVGLKTRYEIDSPVAELNRRGVTMTGRAVLTVPDDRTPLLPGQDPRALRRLRGLIVAVDGDRLRVDTGTDTVWVPADQAWLEARRDIFLDVLAATTGADFPAVVDRLDHEVFDIVGAHGRMARTAEIADGLIKLGPLTVANGIQAAIARAIGADDRAHKVTSRRVQEPTFVFDLGGDKTHRYPDRGLDEFGPFDAEAFTPKAPRIAVVTPRQFQGRVETFMHAFRAGIPGADVFSQGFVRKYRLTDCTMTFTVFDGGTCDAAGYRQACLDAVAATPDIDLGIVITSQEQEHLTGDASPYLVAKSTFMSHGVPVQEFQIEKITRSNLAHPLNTAALACYAKLGGTPYVIKVPGRAMAHELVIGIGSANVQQHRMSPQQRYVGITSVFSADGNYYVSNVSKDAPYEQYPEQLLRSLQTCINDVKARNAWQPQDTIRLIVHVFKPLKDREARAVKDLVDDLTRQYTGVDYAFLTVSEDHDWMLLDRASPGIGQGTRAKGRYVAARGHTVQVSGSEILVSVCGPRDLKLASHGAPRPLLVKLHRESTFTDLDYLAGQVFRFTALSWRRPYPSSRPVTILYSDLIADLLGQLRAVTNWNSDMISTKLRWSRWFL
jgi:Piwi domain